MVFSNARELKNAVRFHAILRGKEIKFARNDKKRIQVVCKAKECPWYIWASHMEGGHCIQIKTYNSVHNCGWTYYNSTLNSKWLAQSYMHKFKLNPKLQARYFRDEMMVHLRSHISKTQAIRARKKAIALVQGTNAEEITKLWDYVQELADTQPHTTVIVKLEDDTNEMGPLEFLRIYLCLGACKLGFLSGCRPIIGVDGCHLKGQGGQLLSAVAIDGNNNMFPLAWAMVEGETKATWRWFLELLHRDIGDEKHYGWTFISDKQKGLIEAMQLVFPEADHRFCVRHMHANFKRAGFGGQALKDALWAAATASTHKHFHESMKKMHDIDEEAANWFWDKPSVQWSRSFFDPYPKCDMLLNNLCESFNSMILDARDKPVITCLETIRNLMMVRWQTNREKAEKWRGKICPRIKQTLHKNMNEAGEFIVSKADQWNYQVMGIHSQHTVNLYEKKCSCRRFELSGIPCNHACAAIWRKGDEPEDYVHEWYHTETYLRSYAHSIMPIKGKNMWPESKKIPPLPPKYEVYKKGRPKKLRRKDFHEEQENPNPYKLARKHKSVTCSYCHVKGHNARSCNKRKHDLVATKKTEVHEANGSRESTGVASNANKKEKLQVKKNFDVECTGGDVNSEATIVMEQGMGLNFQCEPKLFNQGLSGPPTIQSTPSFNAENSTPTRPCFTTMTPAFVRGNKSYTTLSKMKKFLDSSRNKN